MIAAVLVVTASTCAYYLASRAKITEWAWSRYPSWLEYWTLCAACSGAWYGAGAAVGLAYGADLWIFPHWLNHAAGAALGMVWTPILGATMVRGWLDLADVPAEEGADVDAE